MNIKMNQRLSNYKRFFMDQVKEQEIDQQAKMNTPVGQLVRSEEIAVGWVEHLNPKQGHIVIRFPKNRALRLKMQKSLYLVKGKARKECGESIEDWNISFLEFCKNTNYHSKPSDLLPLYYTSGKDPEWNYVGCSKMDIELYYFIADLIKEGKKLQVMVFDPFPPTDYLLNLAQYIDENADNEELLLSPKIKYDEWKPDLLSFNPNEPDSIAQQVSKSLRDGQVCILQGPPGTGKSYTIATIVADYMMHEATVCVTTMANKGILELVQQPPLQNMLADGKIHKTNLTADEFQQVKGLSKAQKGLMTPKGHLTCSTYYVLSQSLRLNSDIKERLSFDLIVIEEASQAFLTALVAFKSLGKRCLIVGDPLQLPPIILNADKNIYQTWDVDNQANGMTAYALGTQTKSFRITTTFRLTPASAKLTGTFYDDKFISVQEKLLDFSAIKSPFFPKEGGVLYYQTSKFQEQVISEEMLEVTADVLNKIATHYTQRSVAIITPFKETVKLLQKHFMNDTMLTNLTVETIDRIQGMTVDYAILYIPARNPGFALNEQRFNVATSRSRSTTLIICDVTYEKIHIPPKVKRFLDCCPRLAQYEAKEEIHPLTS